MLHVDFENTVLPLTVEDVRAFVNAKLPKPLPIQGPYLLRLLKNGSSCKVAAAHLANCESAASLASDVGHVSSQVFYWYNNVNCFSAPFSPKNERETANRYLNVR